MRTNGAFWLSAWRTSRTMPAYALSEAGRVALSSKASPALAVPLRTGPPRRWDAGSGSPVSADSSTTASALVTIPSTGTTSPARTTTRSPTESSSTGTSSTASPTRRWAIRGARATRALSSRRARPAAESSSAFPPASIRPTTAPARYSPSASAAAIATSAIASTPTSPRRSVRPTDQASGTRTTAVAVAQTASPSSGWETRWRSPPTPIAARTPAASRRLLTGPGA